METILIECLLSFSILVGYHFVIKKYPALEKTENNFWMVLLGLSGLAGMFYALSNIGSIVLWISIAVVTTLSLILGLFSNPGFWVLIAMIYLVNNTNK